MENITDQELRRLLSVKGHQIGPVTNTTRSIYQKLYIKLVEEGKYSKLCFLLYCITHCHGYQNS